LRALDRSDLSKSSPESLCQAFAPKLALPGVLGAVRKERISYSFLNHLVRLS
jgi:hypothetical protein